MPVPHPLDRRRRRPNRTLWGLLALWLLAGVWPVAAQPAPQVDETPQRLLVWTAPAVAPGRHSASAPGQVAWLDANGTLTPLLDVPEQSRAVAPCGDEGASPDGRTLAFYAGLNVGGLYLMHADADAPTLLGQVPSTTCLGSGTLQFAPSSARLGYLAFETGSAADPFAAGVLRVVDVADASTLFEYTGVTAYDLTDEQAAFVVFFTNGRGEADEAVVFVWDGTRVREVVSLIPDAPSCQFTSAALTYTPQDAADLALVMGHRCTTGDTRTRWQLVTVDVDGRSATRVQSDAQPGGFLPYARSNSVLTTPDGDTLLFTVPDGVAVNTVALAAAAFPALAPRVLIERQLVMPATATPPNALPRLSPDGRWLAFVTTSPNSQNVLGALDLADLDLPPIRYNAGSQGDVVSAMAFTPTSDGLAFITGGANSANNVLGVLDLLTGGEVRVARGRFGNALVASPSGERVAVVNYRTLDAPRETLYLDTEVYALDGGEMSTWFTGVGEDGAFAFALPLWWFPPAGR